MKSPPMSRPLAVSTRQPSVTPRAIPPGKAAELGTLAGCAPPIPGPLSASN